MTTEINNGGQALPMMVGPRYVHGMSLRAYLAGQALPAVIDVCRSDTLEHGQTREQMFAERAVCCADALIAELAKGCA